MKHGSRLVMFRHNLRSLAALCFLTLFMIPALALLPRPPLNLDDIFNTATQDHLILFSIRLPRVVLAFLTGAALSLAGANFQALLKNPLADPYILGVSGGSALGYVVALIFGLPTALLPLAGFVSALGSLVIIHGLATTADGLNTHSLLLTGVIFNSFSFALILIINTLVPFAQSHQILSLLMGSIAPVAWPQIFVFAVITLTATLILVNRAPALDLLSLGDTQAHHLGLDIVRERRLVFILTSLLVGASVSLCGLIGFVGLFVPHLMRLVFGAPHKRLLPASIFFGGLFLAVADLAATQMAHLDQLGTRLPVGAVTALVGAPVFVWLLKRQARGLT